ncbi:MAG: 50S ribosomal protein L18 [Patescibacteria group bacterium]
MESDKNNLAQRRKIRTRARISRFSDRPKLSVFRSGQHIYAQIIDQNTGKVLAAASDTDIKNKQTKTEKAYEVGKSIGKQAKAKKITAVVFDRGAYKFHGRVKAVCEGAREENLNI